MGGYGDFSPGEKYAPIFINALPEQFKTPLNDGAGLVEGRRQTVLDAGAGSGKGTVALLDKGFAVAMCDISFDGLEDQTLPERVPTAMACLWHDLSHIPYMANAFAPDTFKGLFDWAYCCDVMEHIQPQFTMLVVQQLLNIVRHGVFFSISLTQDQFGYFAGEPLHKTVQQFTWWRDSLGELGDVIDARDLGNVGTYLVMTQ